MALNYVKSCDGNSAAVASKVLTIRKKDKYTTIGIVDHKNVKNPTTVTELLN